jgi:hypothetical protein
VRKAAAVEAVPALITAAYAFLLLAGSAAAGNSQILPAPKWRRASPDERCTTPRLMGMFRSQLWGKAMGVNLTHFAQAKKDKTKPVLFDNALSSAVYYAFR